MFASHRVGLNDSGVRGFGPGVAFSASSGGLIQRAGGGLPLVKQRPIIGGGLGLGGAPLYRRTPLTNALAGTLVSQYGSSLLNPLLHLPGSQQCVQCAICYQTTVMRSGYQLMIPYMCPECSTSLTYDWDPNGYQYMGVYDLAEMRYRLLYGAYN